MSGRTATARVSSSFDACSGGTRPCRAALSFKRVYASRMPVARVHSVTKRSQNTFLLCGGNNQRQRTLKWSKWSKFHLYTLFTTVELNLYCVFYESRTSSRVFLLFHSFGRALPLPNNIIAIAAFQQPCIFDLTLPADLPAHKQTTSQTYGQNLLHPRVAPSDLLLIPRKFN